ncbi:hypothetical protein R6Q59_018913 [Mikania micrantha]
MVVFIVYLANGVNPSIRLIDNMHDSQCIVGFRDDIDYMKKDTCYKVKYIFLMYLNVVDHPKLMEIEGLLVEKLKISGATTKNFVDCCIFVMHHMEMFNANYARSWDCGFLKDERAKKTKCVNVDKKSPVNIINIGVKNYIR